MAAPVERNAVHRVRLPTAHFIQPRHVIGDRDRRVVGQRREIGELGPEGVGVDGDTDRTQSGTVEEVVGDLVPAFGDGLVAGVHAVDIWVYPQRDRVAQPVRAELRRLLHPSDGAFEALVTEALSDVVEDCQRPPGMGGVEVVHHVEQTGEVLWRMALLDVAEIDPGQHVTMRSERDLLHQLPPWPGIRAVQ